MNLNKLVFSDKTKVILIFLSFLLVNVAAFSVVYLMFFSGSTYKTVLEKATEISKSREVFFKSHFLDNQLMVNALRNSKNFKNYLQESSLESKEAVENEITTIMNSHPTIMQVRYIASSGMEKLRIVRTKYGSHTITASLNQLQDKSKREYLSEAKKRKDEKVFFSNIDLNIEFEKVEIPYRPTIRVLKPIFKEKNFEGVLVFNLFIENILEDIQESPLCDTILIDKEGYTLLHFNKALSWGKYQEPKIHISTILEDYTPDILTSDFYVNRFFIANRLDIPIENQPILISIPKAKFISEFNKQSKKELMIFFLIMLLVTVVTTFIIYKIVNKLNLDLFEKIKYEKTLNEYFEVIDDNVISSKTDLKGKITYASQAFANICGYSKAELIGQNHRIIKHPEMEETVFKDLWETIREDKVWKGTIKNRTKSGSEYWVKTMIKPEFDLQGNKIGYISIRQNITEQKIIEKLSITDALTNLYNRRYFNEEVPKIINRLKRNSELFAYLMIDIDHFKQYNDTYGHQKGDEVLQMVAESLNKSLQRSDDYAFRLGGEEFCIIFKADSKEKALVFSEKIKTNIEEMKILHAKNSASKYVTVSMGLTCINANDIYNFDHIYKQTDLLLYKAKQNGRNKINSVSDVDK